MNAPFPITRAAPALLFAALLGGCVVAPLPPYGYRNYHDADVVAVAPPPAQAEYYGAAPAPGYIWIGGFWNWVGGRHVWVGGRWAAPRAGYRWAPHRWERAGGGWRERPGRWER